MSNKRNSNKVNNKLLLTTIPKE